MHSIVRWSIVTTAAMAIYMVGVFAGYPYPEANTGTRSVVYVVAAAILVLAACLITFLAYRLVTMRVVTRGRALYVIFLPAVMLLSSIIAILLLAAPD
ncbi:MAG TPA: hypothetical protein VMM78_15185 [Thermomicrobiales bacterium]|nr:hypothetical protein [Thermomicrobiales bacterium]